MSWLVVPRAKARAVYEAFGRAYASERGKVWDEARGGVLEGVNVGKGIHALHKSITKGVVSFRISADGTEVAFPIRTVQGVNIDDMRGRVVQGEIIPATARELSDEWFKSDE